MRVLVLLHEAFGGRGGIAKFNRDLLTALCAYPAIREVVAIPLLVMDPVGTLPAKLDFRTGPTPSRASWLLRVAHAAMQKPHFDLIVCGHVNLLPIAFAVRRLHQAPLGLVVHGIEAWQPTGRPWTDRLASRIDFFISVSAYTKERFGTWTKIKDGRGFVLPNAVDTAYFTPGPADPGLAQRWRLDGRRVLLTLARLDARERYKGIDEILELMPDLIQAFPDLVYVVAGDGSDRARLEAKAHDLGLAERVVFTGYVAEGEKRDLYRLAHAFAMPSRGEGFGIVFLEAMACGVPAVASAVDGGREAVRDGMIGLMVDPADPSSVRAGIATALNRPRGRRPDGLDHFDIHHFHQRVHAILDRVGRTAPPAAVPARGRPSLPPETSS